MAVDLPRSSGGGLGWSLGPYYIVSSIGSGKFGTVYYAVEPSSGREVALKLVPLEGAESDEKVEAERLGAMLQQRFGAAHKGLVPDIYDHQPRASFYAIAMELVRGEPLRVVIGRGPLPARRAAGIALQICRFLEYAHRFKTDIDGVHYALFVHGDLKPDHVLLLPNGDIRVLDFGIAKALAERTAVTTNKWGSMPYASPERLVSDGHVNAHADFWSLGVMLFEMVAGCRPYHTLEHNQSRLNSAIITHEPRAPLPPATDPVVAAIIGKLLASQLERRYASAADIAADLDAYLAGRETVAGHEQSRASEQTVRISGATPVAPVAPVAPSRRSPPPLPYDDPVPTEPIPAHLRIDTVPTTPVPRSGVSPPPLPADVAPRRRSLPRRVARLAVACVLIYVVAAEGVALTRAERVRSQIAAIDVADIPAVRDDYRSIKEWSPLSIAEARVGGPLADRMIELADRTILEYRTETPAVAEVQWEQARESLEFAAEIRGRSRTIESKQAYVTGQLARIAARSRDGYEDAIRHFRRAATLDSRSPDPYLGMARIYSYDLWDAEALQQAIREAQTRGYRPGRRERAQLGDVHRLRGERARQAASRLSGMARIEQLERAREAYTLCIEYFDGLSFYSSDDNLRACRRRLANVETALTAASVLADMPDAPPAPERDQPADAVPEPPPVIQDPPKVIPHPPTSKPLNRTPPKPPGPIYL